MLNYKHIVIAVDLSPKSEDTLKSVAEMIGVTSETKVSLIHVMEHSPVSYAGEFSIPMDANVEHTLESQARSMLEQLATEYQLDVDQLSVTSGAVKVCVSDFAKEVGADLIIVGSHGHGAMGALLGSRANAILHLAPCDVLVVKHDE